MSWGVSCWVYPFGTLWVSWTWVAISFPILGKFSTIISSSIFSWPFFLCSSSVTHDLNVGVFDIVPEVSEVVLISFKSFFLSASFISTILSSTSFILSSTSVILLVVPSRVFFICYCIIHYFFISLFYSFILIFFRSLLNISCIFSILVSRLFNSILFSRFWIIFTIIILNSFSGRLPISSSLVWFGGHLITFLYLLNISLPFHLV